MLTLVAKSRRVSCLLLSHTNAESSGHWQPVNTHGTQASTHALAALRAGDVRGGVASVSVPAPAHRPPPPAPSQQSPSPRPRENAVLVNDDGSSSSLGLKDGTS